MRLLLALGFLTRIPIPLTSSREERSLSSLLPFFPIVGIIIGLIYHFCTLILDLILPGKIVAFIIVILTVYITGGLHLDGLSDTFDGYFSGKSGDKMIAIMRDSTIGVYGAFSIWFILFGKWIFLYTIVISENLEVLALFPFVGRLILYQVVKSYPYPSGVKGLGEKMKEESSENSFMIVLITLIIMLISTYFYLDMILVIILSLLITGVLVNLFVRKISYKLNGVTGDVYGASCELSELLFMFFLIVGWGM
ncbi:adenosylcobinamide-GDP ribazoletransferase [Natranaerobius trueperi]|uniref:adenosylcobinamide-GDP ribazoletransferase n=1 Tax=Natranaerobius trueperi TaxID=759412 RepID=UPI00130346AF|nr:adenosylcobinamide-GDP ribazoletransferase [Natranaerobius trueperi]